MTIGRDRNRGLTEAVGRGGCQELIDVVMFLSNSCRYYKQTQGTTLNALVVEVGKLAQPGTPLGAV